MTVGAFMRHQAIGTPGPRSVRRPQVDRAALARVLAAFGRIGSNVNQLARAANSGEIPARDELMEAAASVQSIRSALMQALGRGD
jgi:HAMP domain-containing protein